MSKRTGKKIPRKTAESTPPQTYRWWSTSAGLVEKVPELLTSKGWKRFAMKYDSPAAQRKRMLAAEASKRKINREVAEIIAKANTLPGSIPLRSPYLLFSNDPIKAREEAIDELLGIVNRLFKPGNPSLLTAIAKEMAERKSPPFIQKRNLSEGVNAFCAFILREHCLPDREQLNLEANRKAKAVWREASHLEAKDFGQKISGGIVYASREPYFSDDPFSVQVCPENDWFCLRWKEEEVSRTIITPGGFSGLPRKKAKNRPIVQI